MTATETDYIAEIERIDGLATRWWQDASRRAVLAENALAALEVGEFELGESGDNAAVRVPIEQWRDAIELLHKAAS